MRDYDVKIVIDEESEIYTAADFIHMISEGTVWNECGSGYWCRDGYESGDEVFSTPQLDATHVNWYNK